MAEYSEIVGEMYTIRTYFTVNHGGDSADDTFVGRRPPVAAAFMERA